MKDDDGRVLVDGWYDTFDPIGAEEQAALDDAGRDVGSADGAEVQSVEAPPLRISAT